MARMLPKVRERFFVPMMLRGVCGAVMGMVCVTLCASGCSNPVSKMMFTNHKNRNPAMSMEKQQERSEEQAHRAKYQSTRSSADLEWLMKNRIENGLTQKSVNNILGQKGKPAESGSEIAQLGGSTESKKEGETGKDGTYVYGPDDKGRTYRLTFRNSRLVDYNPVTAMEQGAGGGIAQANHTKQVAGRVALDEGEKKSAVK